LHAGVDAGQLPAVAFAVGDDHTRAEDRAGSRVFVTIDEAGDPFRADPKYRLLASYDPLSAAERQEQYDLRLSAFVAHNEGRALEWERSPQRDRLVELDRRGSRIDLFEQLRD
jgi:hypothetical protein